MSKRICRPLVQAKTTHKEAVTANASARQRRLGPAHNRRCAPRSIQSANGHRRERIDRQESGPDEDHADRSVGADLCFGDLDGNPPSRNASSAAWSDFATRSAAPGDISRASAYTRPTYRRRISLPPDIRSRIDPHVFRKDDGTAAAINTVFKRKDPIGANQAPRFTFVLSRRAAKLLIILLRKGGRVV